MYDPDDDTRMLLPKPVRRRRIDEPLVATHIYMIAGVAIVIFFATLALPTTDNWPNHLNFKESPEVRVLCYAWSCMGLLLMSWVLKTGWIVPITLIGLWIGSIYIGPRPGILIGLIVALIVHSNRRK